MSERLYLAKEPTHVPIKWLVITISICSGLLLSFLYVGILYKDIDARVQASERRIEGFEKISAKLDDIKNDVSEMKGILTEIRRTRGP